MTIHLKVLVVLASLFLSNSAMASEDQTVFELRIYTTHDGKLNALHNRFTDHTIAIFDRLGMQSVAYWVADDKPNTLIYVLRHESRDAATKSWATFMKDPAWVKAYKESTKDGSLVSKAPESIYMSATAYSKIR